MIALQSVRIMAAVALRVKLIGPNIEVVPLLLRQVVNSGMPCQSAPAEMVNGRKR
jgi:hypothetical protein